MPSQRPSLYTTLLFFGTGLVMVWLSWMQIQPVWEQLKESFLHANYFWVMVSVIISFLSHLLRAMRWNTLLHPLGYHISIRNSTMFVLIGYLVNYGIPRLGEITRCSLAYKYNSVPIEKSLGTVVLERITDVIIFFLFFITAFIWDFSTYAGLLNKYVFSKIHFSSKSGMQWIFIFILAGFIFFVLYYFRKKIRRVAGERIYRLIKGFAEGIGSFRKLKNPVWFIFIGIVIWLCYFYSLYVCFFAFKGTSSLGQKEALVLLLIGTFAVMFSPGGLGAYPLLLSTILTGVYGTDRISAFAMPWLVWGSQFILILLTGLISLTLLPVLNSRNK